MSTQRKKPRIPKVDLDVAAQIRPRFAVAASAARKAILGGKGGRWTVAPETYVEVWTRGNIMRVDLVVDNFLIAAVRRGGRTPRIDDRDDIALRRWVEEAPAYLVAEAKKASSALLTAGCGLASVILLASHTRRSRRRS